MFWWLLLAFFAMLVLGLLFAPVKLGASTLNNMYFISYGWVLKVTARFLEDDIEIGFKLFGFGKNTTVLEQLAGRKRKKSVPERIATSFATTTKKKVPLKLIIQFLKTFRVKKFFLNVDLGSVYYNAWLYPLGEIFKTQKVYCTTNFVGKTEIDIDIVNRPAHMLWAIIKTQLKSKKS
jgi:hypothetical protein